MYPSLKDEAIISLDVETTGLNWWDPAHHIFGFAISTLTEDYYYDIREDKTALSWLRHEYKQGHIKKIVNHNIKFDLHMLWSSRVKIDPGICECTQIRAALIDEHIPSYSLDSLSEKYLKKNKNTEIYEELAAMFGGEATKGAQMPNIWKAPTAMVAKYAKIDSRLALELWQWQEKEIADQKLERIWKLENDLFPVIFDMERTGVRIDVPKAEKAVKDMDALIARKDVEFQKYYNQPIKRQLKVSGIDHKDRININAPDSLNKLFNPQPILNKEGKPTAYSIGDGFQIPITDTGKPSYKKDILKDMVEPRIQLLLELRQLTKCRDTFLKGHILGHHVNGCLYPNINQVRGDRGGTVTGRFSMSRPALQQIPARNPDAARILRPLFLPEPGELWGCWDYSQFEFRIFSHFINNTRINKIYAEDPSFDFHQLVSNMTGLPRGTAKTVNLGMMYDMGGGTLCRMMGLPYTSEEVTFKGQSKQILVAGEEGKALVEKYYAAIPGVKDLREDAKAKANAVGFVTTIGGRRIRFPGRKFTHKAKALHCQGSAADCMKQKMVELYPYCKTHGITMILMVHDELNLSVPVDKVEECRPVISKILETFDGVSCPIKLRIPILTDSGIGENWASASGKGL